MSPTDLKSDVDSETAADDMVDASTDAEAIAEESDSHSPPTEPRKRWTPRWPGRRTLVTAAGAALLLVSVGSAAVLGWDLRRDRAVDDAGQQALAAAQQYAVILTAVDTGHLDQNFAAVLDGATGEFKDMYSQSSAQLKQVLLDSKAKADGKVIAAGIKSASADKVEVMLFLDQSVTNALNPEPRIDRNRLILTMQKVNGRWLASNVELP